MSYVVGAKVVTIIEHSENVREYCLKLDKSRKYEAGSFVQLTLDQVTPSEIWPDSRTFSIASYNSEYITLIIQRVGVYTNRIFHELSEGSRCTLKYPFGELFAKSNIAEKNLFIAGGVGITPFFSLLDFFTHENMLDNLYLIYSVKHLNDVLHREKIEKSLDDRVHYFVTRESDSCFTNRRITVQDINEVCNMDNNCHIYICGSKNFNDYYFKELGKAGFTSVHMDEWD